MSLVQLRTGEKHFRATAEGGPCGVRTLRCADVPGLRVSSRTEPRGSCNSSRSAEGGRQEGENGGNWPTLKHFEQTKIF